MGRFLFIVPQPTECHPLSSGAEKIESVALYLRPFSLNFASPVMVTRQDLAYSCRVSTCSCAGYPFNMRQRTRTCFLLTPMTRANRSPPQRTKKKSPTLG